HSPHPPSLPLSFPTRRSSDLVLHEATACEPAHDIASPFMPLPLEPPDRKHRGQRGADLQRENEQRPSGPDREPTDREIRDDGHRSEEHTSELQSRVDLVCRLL